MKHDELAARVRSKSLRQGTFLLRSGKTTDIYFDKYGFESDPEILELLAQHSSTDFLRLVKYSPGSSWVVSH